MLEIIPFPAATTTIAAMSEYSEPWFEALLPVMYIAVGTTLAVMIILWLKEKLLNALTYLFTSGSHNTDSLGNPEPSDINIHYRNPPYKH